MATITEEQNAQIAKIKRLEEELRERDARMEAYQNIKSIKKWVKFFGILAIIGLILAFLGIS